MKTRTFNHSYEDLIRTRKSSRNYTDTQVSPAKLDELLNFANSFQTDLYYFKLANFSKDQGDKLGTYGLVKNASTFLVAIGKMNMRNKKEETIEFGKTFERIILKATDMGIQTCWMGMSFDKANLSKQIGAKKDERIIMVTPLGYAKEVKGQEKLTRQLFRFDKRLPWQKIFFKNSFETPIETPKELDPTSRMALEMLRLAPSAANSQPWRVVLTKDAYHFYIKPKAFYERNKKLSISFTHNDLGIGLMHFESIMESHGVQGHYFKDVSRRTSPNEKLEYITSWKKD